MSNQLVKKNPTEGYQNVFPKTWIDAIKDKESGVSLQEILQGFNMYFLSYNGSRALTRCKVPAILRKEGLWITYVLYDHTVVTEWYNSDQIDDNSWSMDSNWRIASNNLVGDISVSSDGYWVINGEKTEAKAQGEQGVTPLLRVGANNKLQVSYNAGKAWKDISDYIVPRFKWNQGVGTTAGTIQISMDLGKTWTNLSNEITNNLRISRYIDINESLPTSGVAEGTIYMKGPYYNESDTSNTNPIYRMWVYAWKGNTLAWQDNGEFTSISAGVVQERGNSTTKVMSQDAITRELTELESEAIYDVTANNNSATFSSLSELLSSENLSTLIPTSVRHGGMSIRFIQSSDNKYVQYRLMEQNFTTDVTQWQGVDDNPTPGSKNLVDSGGVISFVRDILKCVSSKPQVVDGGVNKTDGSNSTGTTKRTDFIEIPNDSGILVKGAIGNVVTPIAIYSSNTIDSFIEAEQNNELVYYPSSYIKSVGAKYLRYCIGSTQYNNDDYCILFTDKNIDEEIKNIPLIARSPSAAYNGTAITIDIVSVFSITGEKKDYYADGDSTQHSPVTYNLNTGHLVITERGRIEQRYIDSYIQSGDIILLSYNTTQQKIVGGLLFTDYVNKTIGSKVTDIENSLLLKAEPKVQSGLTIDIDNNVFKTPVSNQTRLYYIPVKLGDKVKVNSSVQTEGTSFLTCFSSNVPSINEQIVDTQSHGSGAKDFTVISPINGYFCVAKSYTVYTDLTFYTNYFTVIDGSLQRINTNIKQFVVSSSARVISDNVLGLTFVRIKDNAGNDKMIYVNNEHIEEEFTFNSSTLGALVIDENDAIVSRANFASIASTDFVLLSWTSSVNRFTAGALLPYLAYSKSSGSEPATSYSATVYRNICIALLNKLGERLGMEQSSFLGVDGSSKVCARDMVWMIIAGITNNFISSVWCKDVVYAPVYGDNARLDTYESSFVDTVSHPMVADLSNYYHIWGGKTGSALISNVYVGKNLCIAVKSKIDDSWLVGCVLNSTADVQGDNRFSVMKQLFDLLETHRDGASVDTSSLRCEAAYALVLPNNGNILSYHTYNDFVYVSKNGESLITDSRSITKVMTALVVLENLNVNEKIHVTADDLEGYGGHSGSMYQDGDEIYIDDALTTLLLTSSSHACWFLARKVGQEFMKHNPNLQLYAFRLARRTAYGVGTQTWLQWLDTPDYLVWSAKTGLTISCSGSDANVELSDGSHISGVTGGSVISKSTMYNTTL